MPEERKKRMPRPLAVTVMCAMLAAISIVCGKYLAIPGGDVLRFSFENLPILFAGYAFGPIAGVSVGAVADLLGSVMVSYPINPIITVGAAATGLVSGILSIIFKRLPRFPLSAKVAITVSAAHLIGSVAIKTAGLAAFYAMPYPVLLLWRLLNYLIVGILEGIILYILLHNRAIDGYIRRMNAKRRPASEIFARRPRNMSYDEALEYIHGISWTFCKPGLERIGELCEKLGHPERELKFIHIAGTNGKGSFAALCDSVLREAGYKVGLYTSPYILSFNERMRVNGVNIPNATLAEITEHVKPIADAMEDRPTEFELITAIALEYFRRARVDVVVFEAGMGGRLDSTNIIENPLLSVITGVALDHTAYLGDTVEKIAAEKAGIIKPHCPVLFGGESESLRRIIADAAKEKNADLYCTDYSCLSVSRADLNGTAFSYRGEGFELGMLGLYQPRNAASVIEGVNILRRRGLNISDEALRAGLLGARWPARFEVLSNEPLVIFDGAHNPDGVNSATESLSHYFGEERVYVLTGVLRDKDYEHIADRISQVAARAYTITPNNPRALPAREYAEVLRKRGLIAVTSSSIKEALSRAMAAGRQDKIPVVVLGSLYTYVEVVDAMRRIEEEQKERTEREMKKETEED